MKKVYRKILVLFAIAFLSIFFAKNVDAATSNYSVYPVTNLNGCNATNVCTYKTFYVNFWNGDNTDHRFQSTTATLKKNGSTVKSVTRSAESGHYMNWTNADFYVTESGTYTLERKAVLTSGSTLTWDTTTFTIYDPSQTATISLSSSSASLSMTGTTSTSVTMTRGDICPDRVSARYSIANGNVTCSWGDWSNGSIPLTITGKYGGTDTVTMSLVATETGNVIASKTVSVSIGPNYTVSYNANGGSGAPSSQTKYYGKTLTLSSSTPTRSGYNFLGWSTSSTATSPSYYAGGSYTSNSSTTLYAVWQEITYTYTISFNANGGSGAPSSISKTGSDTSVVMGDISNTVPTRDGYTFYGWSASSSWSSKRIAYSSSYGGGTAPDGTSATSTSSSWTYSTYCSNSGGSTSSRTLTLYAQWQARTYTVSYNANGGSGAPSSQTKTKGSTITLSNTIPTRSGYTFVGWGTSSTSTSYSYSAGSSYSNDANITLYAIWKKTITLTYNANGGSGAPSSSSATVYNATTDYVFSISSTVPTRSGYDFLGWSTSSSATSASYDAGGRISLSSNATLYAVWSGPITYTVSYNANGGSGAPSSQTKTKGTSLTLSSTKPTRSGWTFVGWGTSSSTIAISYTAGGNYSTDANITLYAIWSKSVTIRYNGNGGSMTTSSTSASYYHTETYRTMTIISTLPTREGYNFLGWSTSSTATSASYQPGGSINLSDDITLYAVWSVDPTKTFTVTYNANGGSGAPASQTKISGTDLTLSTTVPTRSGWTFMGWGTSSTSTGYSYSAGSIYTKDASITLYAVWRKTVRISYNANGGSMSVSATTSYYYNSATSVSMTITSTVPTWTDHTFLGWSTSSTATSASYQPNDSIALSSDITLYAVWQANTYTYTITFNANGGSGVPASIAKGGTDTSVVMGDISSTIPTREGYTFYGWSASSSWNSKRIAYGSSSGGGTAPDGSKATTTSSSWTYSNYCSNTGGSTSSRTLTLYAQWQANTYTVTYDANGGSGAPSSQTKTYGTTLTLSSTVPTRSGWDFLGWGTSSTSTSSSYSAGASYTSNANITLYAIWRKGITLTYNVNGGSALSTNSVTGYIYNAQTDYTFTIQSATPTKSGYNFLGWSTSSSATSATYHAGDSVTLSANTTIYAVWSAAPVTYTITYNANGGSGAPSSQSFTSGNSTTLSNTVPTKSGYTFLGWSTSSSATSATYSSSQSVTFTGNTTLYAIWRKSITLSYNANGGSGAPSSVTGYAYNSNTSYSFTVSSTVPTKSGYNFAGWSTSSSASSASYTGGNTISISSNTTLYAVWSAVPVTTYTITYNANGGSGAPSSQSFTSGSSVTLSSTTPTKSGYTFMGWGTSSSTTSASYSSGQSVTFTSNKTLYAIWKKTITLTYNANGGSGAPSTSTASVYNATTSYTFTISNVTPTRSGYSFLGWNTSSGATSAAYVGGNSLTLSANQTLYAVWEKEDAPVTYYTINYYANGGSGAPASRSGIPAKSIVDLSNLEPERTGYRFMGWGTSSSATSPSYAAGDEVTINSNLNLYAVWRIDTETYTVTYNANGGSGAPAAQTKTKGATLTLSSTKPTRSGWTFLGWSTNNSATSAAYGAGGSFTTDANTVLYAIWRKSISLSYNTNGGSGTPASSSVNVYNANTSYTFTISSSVPIRSGYTFLGWSTSSSAASASYNSGTKINISSNTTLYAVWRVVKVDQVITAADKTVAYPSSSFYFGATTSGNGALSYTSSNPNVISVVSNGLVTVKGYGEAIITIRAAETTTYKAASKMVKITAGPKAVKLATAKSTKKKNIVGNWKKNSAASGYQVYVSLKSNFISNTIARSYKAKVLKFSLTGVKSKKYYYVKVRAYKTVGGKKYYGPWGNVKKVKVK